MPRAEACLGYMSCSNLQRPPRVVYQALISTQGGRGIYGDLIAPMDWALLPVGEQ